MAGVSKLFSELNLVKDNLLLIFKVGVAILVKAFDGFWRAWVATEFRFDTLATFVSMGF